MASQSRRQKRQMLKTLGLLGKNGNRTPLQKSQGKHVMDLLNNIGSGVSKVNEKEAEVMEAQIINKESMESSIDGNVNTEDNGTKQKRKKKTC